MIRNIKNILKWFSVDRTIKDIDVPLEEIIKNISRTKSCIGLGDNSAYDNTKINILPVDFQCGRAIGIFVYKKQRIEVPVGIQYKSSYSDQFLTFNESGQLNVLGKMEDTLYLRVASSGIDTKVSNVTEENKDKTNVLCSLAYPFADTKPFFVFIEGPRILRGFHLDGNELHGGYIYLGDLFREGLAIYNRAKLRPLKKAKIIIPEENKLFHSVELYQKGRFNKSDIKEIEKWVNNTDPDKLDLK